MVVFQALGVHVEADETRYLLAVLHVRAKKSLLSSYDLLLFNAVHQVGPHATHHRSPNPHYHYHTRHSTVVNESH